jgi:hypothetical protein
LKIFKFIFKILPFFQFYLFLRTKESIEKLRGVLRNTQNRKGSKKIQSTATKSYSFHLWIDFAKKKTLRHGFETICSSCLIIFFRVFSERQTIKDSSCFGSVKYDGKKISLIFLIQFK